MNKKQRKKKLHHSKANLEDTSISDDTEKFEHSGETNVEDSAVKLPEGTPDWGIKLLEIIQSEFRSVTQHMSTIEGQSSKNTKDVKVLEKKLATVEQQNKVLMNENISLCERLLDLEYKQKQCNLLFEGIDDSPNETDVECIRKLCQVLNCITDWCQWL